MKLYLVPLEPLKERYTEQWYRRLPVEFSDKFGFDVEVIDGEPLLDDEISVGTFLDINSTTHYKWTQLQKISKMFHNGEIEQDSAFFFSDVEFWGLESLRLLADMNKVRVTLTGFLHAGSYTKEDAFEIAARYQRYTEVGWVAALDLVFVGSNYHRDAFIERRLKPLNAVHLANRIVVTGNPLFREEYPTFNAPKKKIAVMPNRFDYEKRPDESLVLFDMLAQRHPDWRFVVCTGRPHLRSNKDWLTEMARMYEHRGSIIIEEGLSKRDYHHLLAEAYFMVSHSIEENYGYCIAEALIYGCIPVLRKGLSHKEHVSSSLLFSDMGEALAICERVITSFDDGEDDKPTPKRFPLKMPSFQAVDHIGRRIKEHCGYF